MISYLEWRNQKLNAEFAFPLNDLAIDRGNSLKAKQNKKANKVKGK